jgi:phosphoribosyl 1,2-cyclic phosphodiesterase
MSKVRLYSGNVVLQLGGFALLNVTFFGVRGSTPCPCEGNMRYGGNTACVALEAPGCDPIILDLGTGLRFFGETQPADGSFRGHALITHLHWDHVQGLPFFVPVNRPGARLDVYGPPQDDGLSLEEAFGEFMRPPYFPVRVSDLAGDFHFHTLDNGEHVVGDAKVRSLMVPHVGPTNGYRVEMNGVTVVYISDHQQPLDGSLGIADGVLELCADADLLIHDAQYTKPEFALKSYWGHCTIEYALNLAREAGVRRLALYHHDPDHDDDTVDALLAEARLDPAGAGITEIFAAYEGLTLALSPSGTPAAVAEPVSH